MSKFNVGDTVMVIKDYSSIELGPNSSRLGQVFTIIGIQVMYNIYSGRSALVNVVNERAKSNLPGTVLGFEDEYLKRIDDNDDGRCYEKTEWDDAIYKPRELVRIEND